MKNNTKYKGAFTAIVTPWNSDGSIDFKSLKNLVNWQIESGVDGLVPCGSTGEAATMNYEEYEQVVEAVVRETKGRVPVIAGAGSNDTQKAIRISRLAKDAGADGLLHVTPYYNKPTLNGLIAHYKAIADAVDLPIILYNVPGRTGLNSTAQMTLSIAKKVDQVIGVKEASGNIAQITQIIKDSSRDFSVLSGDDYMTLSVMATGGSGVISVVSNEIPREFTDFVHAALDDNWQKAKKMYLKYFDLMQVNFIETNPIPVKTALSLMGKIGEYFRLPLTTMDQKNKDILINTLRSYGLIPAGQPAISSS